MWIVETLKAIGAVAVGLLILALAVFVPFAVCAAIGSAAAYALVALFT